MSNWFSQRHAAPAASNTHSPAALRSRSRTLSIDALHIFVLASFAVAQPVYDRLGERSVFLVDQNITPATVKLLVFLLSFGLPAAMVFVEIVMARWRRRVQDSLHSMLVFVLLVLLALPIWSRVVFLPGFVMLSAALATGGLGVWCYSEFRWARAVVTWAAPGVLIFPAMFLAQFSKATATFGPSANRSERWEPAPVVLLVFDEFCGSTLMNPEREIDADRFPNFAALARQSTWFRNAASVAPLTREAVPAILSGRYPAANCALGPADLPQNVFSVLTSAGGYELAAFEPVSNLAPRSLAATGQRPAGAWQQTFFLTDTLWRVYLFHVTPSDYHSYLPLVPHVWFGWHDSRDVDRTQHRGVFRYGWSDQRSDQFQHFLDCIDGSERPVLYFGHFLLPHVPWCYLPSGNRYSEDSADSGFVCLESHDEITGGAEHDDLAVTQNQQRYLLQLMYVDRLIGRLLSRLAETGILDRCLLIVTADHGVSFRAKQPRRWLVPDNQDDILSIPLFIKRPRQTIGEINDRAVESIDILPTIADVIGLTLHAPTDGWSVFDTLRPERTQLTVIDNLDVMRVDPTILKNSQTPVVLRQRFGKGSDPEALFRIGPIPELVGRTVESLEQSSDSQVEINLLRYDDEVSDATNSTRPCYYEGTIVSPKSADEPVVLAIAINGTIRAVTRPYQQLGFSDQWAAMVPEESFHAGRNDVRFFSVHGSDWRLMPCIVSDSTE